MTLVSIYIKAEITPIDFYPPLKAYLNHHASTWIPGFPTPNPIQMLHGAFNVEKPFKKLREEAELTAERGAKKDRS